MRHVIWSDFGMFLRYLREREGLSQEKLAGLVGCDRTHIWRLEHGKRRPSKMMVHALARLLTRTSEDRKMLKAFDQMLEHHCEELDDNFDDNTANLRKTKTATLPGKIRAERL